MPWTEYNIYVTLWEDGIAESVYYWNNRSENWEAATLEYSYKEFKLERRRNIPIWTEEGRNIPVWTEV